MLDILNNFLTELSQGDRVKDYSHAAKLFGANNYELAPKSSYLYFVHFDLNTETAMFNKELKKDQTKRDELGMLVKQVSLPKFTIDTKSLNAYNRPHVVQNKIHNDPVNIVFHDDSANRVRHFWYDYYSYYYRNSDYATSGDTTRMNQAHKEIMTARGMSDWGYTTRTDENGNTNVRTAPYINNIRIYSLFNKQFSEYVLVNPIIKSFQHGEHNASASTDTLTHTMVVEYESVLYAYGKISPQTVKGFGQAHYDRSPSPLLPVGGGAQNITGLGGLLNAGADIVHDVEDGNLLGAVLTGAREATTFKGADFGAMARSEAMGAVKGVLSGNNPFGAISIPGIGDK